MLRGCGPQLVQTGLPSLQSGITSSWDCPQLSPGTGNALTGSKELENTGKIETCKCCSGEEGGREREMGIFFLMPAGALSFMDEEEGGFSW